MFWGLWENCGFVPCQEALTAVWPRTSSTRPSNTLVQVCPRQTLVHVVIAGTALKQIGQEWKISNEKAYQQFLSASDLSGNNHACTDGGK